MITIKFGNTQTLQTTASYNLIVNHSIVQKIKPHVNNLSLALCATFV